MKALRRWVYRMIGFDIGYTSDYGLLIWLFYWRLAIKDTKRHTLLFSQRNGYTGKRLGRLWYECKRVGSWPIEKKVR